MSVQPYQLDGELFEDEDVLHTYPDHYDNQSKLNIRRKYSGMHLTFSETELRMMLDSLLRFKSHRAGTNEL